MRGRYMNPVLPSWLLESISFLEPVSVQTLTTPSR
jgi:hypothetical protein